MPLSPMTVGETHVKISFTWTDDSGTAIDLTGATITARFVPDTGTPFAGAGAVALTAPTQGKGTYTFNASDVSTKATYQIQFKAVFGDGTVLFSDPIGWTLKAAL